MFEVLPMKFYKKRNKRKLAKRKNFIGWIKEHGIISFDQQDKPDEIPPSSNDEKFSFHSAIKKLIVFIGLKFKF